MLRQGNIQFWRLFPLRLAAFIEFCAILLFRDISFLPQCCFAPGKATKTRYQTTADHSKHFTISSKRKVSAAENFYV